MRDENYPFIKIWVETNKMSEIIRSPEHSTAKNKLRQR